MADPQMKEFYGRVRRIERSHRRGLGFEAAGTLGRSTYRAPVQRRSIVRPLLLLLAGGMLLKTVLFMQIGPIDYNDRVSKLATGTQVEQIGAWVMQADGVTIGLANFLGEVFKSPV